MAREAYGKLLDKVRAQITADTTWDDFKKLVETDPRFKAMGEVSADRKERRNLFEAIVTPLRQIKEKGAANPMIAHRGKRTHFFFRVAGKERRST